ncbi:AAA family ATPase [Ferviditalea candida]|uniref:AAA family ATPase n=1 Tax=Ferviditalea candida TaxID=3108399 RepID=A0ABU5ZJR8_9BACL|nr:AAA family ATPase [Paenibacillaceae bacterium T2]
MSGGAMTESIDFRQNSRRISVVLRNQDQEAPSKNREFPLSSNSFPLEKEFADILSELDRMVGLEHVKELVYEIYALLQVEQFRKLEGLLTKPQVYHMVFKGNPGTGKTTVARILGKLFKTMGVLKKGHLLEVERADLVGEYIGHTAIKTRDLIKKAMGGIMFVDEAYSLARGGEKDFGKEAIDCMVKAMEDHREDFVLILAGYSEEMDYFLSMNPGLPSRFPIQVDFPDYTVEQLMQIANLMLQEREYLFAPLSAEKFRIQLAQVKAQEWEGFSNARYIRNLIEKSIRYQAVRLVRQHMRSPSKQELMTIRPEDLQFDKI